MLILIDAVTGHAAHAAYVVIAAVLGPTIPTVAWLIVTYSYRKTKLMIIREVGRHVTEADLGPATPEDPSGWGHRSMPHVLSSARHSGDPLLTVNPLSAQYPVSAHHTAEAAPSGMQKVARHIAVRSLRRWDGILGFRAGSDGLGNAQGVWRDKFEGVRFAVLLLAMRKLNEELQLRSEAHAPGMCMHGPHCG